MLEQIKASAGSGKTYTLTRRFLELLCKMGQDIPKDSCHKAWRRQSGLFTEILAMTFTNKAAAEMKMRVINTLKQIALADPSLIPLENCDNLSPAAAAAWLDSILRRYDALNIRTIDSLLNLLIKISAVTLKIPPDFELAFDEKAFFSPLYDELLDAVSGGDAECERLLEDCAAYLLNHTQYSGLTPKGRIQERLLEVLAVMQSSPKPPCTDENELHARWHAAHNEILQCIEVLQASMERQGVEANKNLAAFFEKTEHYRPGQDFPASAYTGKPNFSHCCAKVFHSKIDDNLEEAYRRFCSAVAANAAKLELYGDAINLLPYAKTAGRLLPAIERLQNDSGQIAGNMLPVLAAKVLDADNGVSEACCRLGSRLTHLLIDEFQDTSRAQWAALQPLVEECLSRGGSLYYVGDVKQAIYSWRGGDSTLFDEVTADPALTSMEPEPLLTSLEHNWRSAPEVVRHNNMFFSRLSHPKIAEAVAASMLPSAHPREFTVLAAAMLARAFENCEQKLPRKNASNRHQGFVQLHKITAEDAEDLQAQVGEKLQNLFLQNLLKRRNPGDIAVLVRTSDEAAFVANRLLSLGISVVTEHSFRLEANPVIRRLVALLRFLDYPPDDLNFINFISGPEVFCRLSGLDAQDVLAWAAGARKEQPEGGRQKHAPLYRLFARDFPELWAAWLEPFYNQSGLMGPYDTVAELYKHFNLFGLAPDYAIYLRRFLELLLGAEKQGYSSLAAFLDYWEDKGKEEKIPSPESPNAVRIMTIHKAKGLEFKVVVMPFHRFSGAGGQSYTLHECGGLNLLVRSSKNTGKSYYLAKNTEALEKLYLLYVAWTRAGEELYAFVGGAPHDLRNSGIPKALELLLADFRFSQDGIFNSGALPEVKDSAVIAAPTETPPAGKPCSPANYTMPDAGWRPMRWLPALKIFRNPVPEVEYDQRARGILFHNCLENIYMPENKADLLRDLPIIIERSINHSLRNFHLPLASLETAKAEITDTLLWFCNLPQAPDWLEKGRAEQVIMDKDGANYRMDMLVEETENALLVLEYKTGAPRPEHEEQLRHYLALLAENSAKKTRGMLVYLDGRNLREVLL